METRDGTARAGRTELRRDDAYLPLAGEAAAALFQMVAERYVKGRIVLTTNRGIAQWGQMFNDDATVAAAMLDRLLHKSTVLSIEGDSHRMRAHRDRVTKCSAAL